MNSDRIREILNRHDPMGLMSIGCPDDEYKSEARSIAASMVSGVDSSNFPDIVFDIFRKSFSYDEEKSLIIDCPAVRERYRKIALEILSSSPLTSS
jgi:hypothetical protein